MTKHRPCEEKKNPQGTNLEGRASLDPSCGTSTLKKHSSFFGDT